MKKMSVRLDRPRAAPPTPGGHRQLRPISRYMVRLKYISHYMVRLK